MSLFRVLARLDGRQPFEPIIAAATPEDAVAKARHLAVDVGIGKNDAWQRRSATFDLTDVDYYVCPVSRRPRAKPAKSSIWRGELPDARTLRGLARANLMAAES